MAKKKSAAAASIEIPSNLLPKEYKKILKDKVFISVFSIVLVLSLITILTIIFFLNRIYPGVKVAGVDLSAKNQEEAQTILSDKINMRLTTPLVLNYQPSTASSSLQQFTLHLDPSMVSIEKDQGLKEAFSFLHQQFSWPPPSLKVGVNFNPSFDQKLNQIGENVDEPPIDSQISIDETGQILVTPSQEGVEIDRDELKKLLTDYLNTGTLSTQTLPTKILYPKLSYQTGLILKKRLDQIKLAPLQLTFKDHSFDLDLPTLISFIDLDKSTPSLTSGTIMGQPFNIEAVTVGKTELSDNQISLKEEKINGFLTQIAKQVDQQVEEPLFSFDPSSPNKVKEFRPPQEGRKLNIALAKTRITDSLLNVNQTKIELPVEIVSPQNKLVNDLGIKELLGTGVSNFAHSIENRIYNLSLAAARVNGVLIPPGQVFSFNQTVGDISAATGYKQAYVIKSGRTVLDDGGGVCQVSTTLFRAALNSGLPITDRTAHAYRVSYYEQGFSPGLDATTYYPTVDFKFRNDTSAHILIQTRVEGLSLYVDFYGTSDGRVATLTKPAIVSQTPALPELRQDDPTLPKGTIKQVDWAASGANVIFNRTVTRGGQTIIQDTFRSNYRPWQAVFLVGTKEG